MKSAQLWAIALATALSIGPIATASAQQGCPPGLAKKQNGCTPPGLAKKSDGKHAYKVGESLDGDYVIVQAPREYDLDPRYTYARAGDAIYRVDTDTKRVLAIIGLLSDLAN